MRVESQELIIRTDRTWPARSWLKTFGQFWCTGGGFWCAIFPDWCKPGAEVGLGCFLGIGWPVHRNQKLVLEIPFFGFKILFLGENMVLRFQFVVLRFHFLGSEVLMKILQDFQEIARETRSGEVNNV